MRSLLLISLIIFIQIDKILTDEERGINLVKII